MSDTCLQQPACDLHCLPNRVLTPADIVTDSAAVFSAVLAVAVEAAVDQACSQKSLLVSTAKMALAQTESSDVLWDVHDKKLGEVITRINMSLSPGCLAPYQFLDDVISALPRCSCSPGHASLQDCEANSATQRLKPNWHRHARLHNRKCCPKSCS